MKFLITGATGFIGMHLVARLLEQGHTAVAFVRRTSRCDALKEKGVQVVVGDIFTGEGFAAALDGVDCVIHLAGLTKARSEAELFQSNAEVTDKLISIVAQRENPPRFVLCSSLAAAGPTLPGKLKREEDAPAPVSAYGRSKLAAEHAVRRHAARVSAVIVRPPIVYGPEDHEFLPSVLPMAKLGLVLKSGFGPKRYSLVHVADLCDGIILAALSQQRVQTDNAAAGVYFISDGCGEYSWEQVCQALGKAIGKSRMAVLPVPEVFSYVAGMGSELTARLRGTIPALNVDKAREIACSAWTCSDERARRELAYEPAWGLEAGLNQTIAWYRQGKGAQ